MVLDSTEAILACVEAGLGVGFASRFALRRQRKLGTLGVAHLTGVRVTRQLSILQQRGPIVTGPADEFLNHLRMYAKRRTQRKALLAEE
jgi:DNA-binding transcriptional LysR family regulator